MFKTKISILKKNLFIIIFLLTVSAYSFASNFSKIELVRDIELEVFTNQIIDQLLSNSDLNSEDLNIYFINNPEVNAFVTSGSDMFINTGLILHSEDYREYTSVIAHELSHIIGAHVSRSKEKIKRLGGKLTPVYLLGLLGIMGGNAEVGLAALMVGQAGVTGGYLEYSRTQEAAADQLAIRLMCENNIDASFLLTFFNKLEKLMPLTNEINPYNTTHPITSSRYTWVESGLKKYNTCKSATDINKQKEFDFVKAKIFGFTKSYNEVAAVYSGSDELSLYAGSVSNYLKGNNQLSIKNLDILIQNNKNNPYFKELLAEIYFSMQDYKMAIQYQNDAINLSAGENDLYHMMQGSYLLASNKNLDESIKALKKSIRINHQNSYSWHLLAQAYAEDDSLALAQYATAERYYLMNDRSMALKFVQNSLKEIKKNTTEWYRANDLLNILSTSSN